MPSLADELESWYQGGGAPGPAPRNVTELVDQLGGTRAAAQFLGINPRTDQPYAARTVERYVRYEAAVARGIDPRSPAAGQTRNPAGTEGAFNRAVADLMRGRERPIHVEMRDVDVSVGNYEATRRRRIYTQRPITPRELRPVLDRLARGRPDLAARQFERLMLRNYGIPDVEGQGANHIGELGQPITIRRA